MKPIHTLLLTLFVCTAAHVPAQDIAHHRSVYADINKKEKSLKASFATLKDEDLQWTLKAWSDGTGVRKIVAKVPGEDGDGFEEFYLEGGKLLFAFRSYTGGDGGKVEDRFYFTGGKMIHWLGADKKPVSKDANFTAEAERLTGNCAKFLKALAGKAAGKDGAGGKEKTGALTTTTGTFLGIEEGDYFHWEMKTAAGEEVSYFILRPDKSVEKVSENPAAYVGRKCTVKWKTTKEKIPEAGGEMEVEQVVSVEWAK
jgi:hypothetical protein